MRYLTSRVESQTRRTFLLHPDHRRLGSRLTDPHCVVGTHSEAVLLLASQPGHFVRGVFALASDLSPLSWLCASLIFDLNHVALDGAAAVVARARPGEHQAGGGDGGDDGAGGGRLGSL